MDRIRLLFYISFFLYHPFWKHVNDIFFLTGDHITITFYYPAYLNYL